LISVWQRDVLLGNGPTLSSELGMVRSNVALWWEVEVKENEMRAGRDLSWEQGMP